jgi:hypothetical protein
VHSRRDACRNLPTASSDKRKQDYVRHNHAPNELWGGSNTHYRPRVARDFCRTTITVDTVPTGPETLPLEVGRVETSGEFTRDAASVWPATVRMCAVGQKLTLSVAKAPPVLFIWATAVRGHDIATTSIGRKARRFGSFAINVHSKAPRARKPVILVVGRVHTRDNILCIATGIRH